MMQPFIFSVMRELGASRLDAAPAVDAYRRGSELILHVDMPGVDLGSVDVEVDDRLLTVSGERTYAPEPGDHVLVEERPFGRFQRQFRLRESVDSSAVSAVLDNGVLTVRLPIATASAAKVKVEVRSDAAPAQ
jgi:HSP20 family protein